MLDPDGTVTVGVGTAEFGNGTATVHASSPPRSSASPRPGSGWAPPTPTPPAYDTGAFGSTGSVVAGLAVAARRRGGAPAAGRARRPAGPRPARGAAVGDRPQRRHAAVGGVQRARRPGRGAPGHRRAADPATRCTPSTPGVVINPEQLRGQVEGGVAQALGTRPAGGGAGASTARCSPAAFRSYRMPQIADVPPTEVLFADTYDELGPRGREVDERGAVQPGRAGARQRGARRRRRPPARAADEPGPHLAPDPRRTAMTDDHWLQQRRRPGDGATSRRRRARSGRSSSGTAPSSPPGRTG